ncbi:hypothetical protein CEP54_002196 [Fusarium duplospermum]|uniref:Uncharacterized protein n=1 Tax=Fusarium duplospermum TaxID=1325734 RepID=A0A428QWR0_9HYPO|nr:hypothetical protein CEP54_002196 [Fusarium duplospermum]
MSDKAALSANDAIDMMENISTKLREAIIKSMPCAFEQYLTISIPGQVIDTSDGGTFVSDPSNKMTVDRHDEVRVNESRLVDAMVPLDKIMLGPTGKSVSRSYYTALDTLVPRKTDIGSTDIDLDAKPNKSTRMNRADQQGSAEYSERQKNIRNAQAETHARWMDWVVNGDKFRVDYAFALVDRDSIMARIEKAKEATRDAMVLAIDGTEWASVTLEPKNWAYLCQAKAREFKNRNPIDPDMLRMKLENLRRMKHAYQTYETSFKDGEEDGLAHLQKVVADCQGKVTELNSKLSVAKAKEPATKEDLDPIQARLTDAEGKLKTAQEELEKKKGEFKLKEEEADQNLQKATKELYEYEKKVSAARKKVADDKSTDKASSKKELETAVAELEKGKDKWIEARRLLQAAQSRKAMAEMEMSGRKNMSKSVQSHVSRLDQQIEEIESLLERSSVPARGLPSAIIDIDADRNIIRADESDMRAQQAPPAPDNSSSSEPDVWTKIAFTIESRNESTSTKERSTSAGINLKADGWFASVQADSSVSSASKEVQKALSECTVDGSFSAILVTIRRPWLHADLFQDFDIDTPDDVKLSPGAAKIKTWIERGDNGSGPDKLTDYGKFPAYPTSFIVAADTVLEFKSNESKSEELMSNLSTDSSIKASYGPWGLSGGASLKTDNKESSMKMEVRGGALRISFQAPQIIGWVSEILPQLPRQTGKIGGLSGPPNRLFRL